MAEANALFAKVGADTSQLQSAYNAAGAALNRTAEEVARTAASMAALTEKIDFQERRAAIQRTTIESLTAKYGENSTQVARAQLQYDQLTSSIAKNRETLAALEAGQISSTNKFDELGARIASLNASIQESTASNTRLASSFASMEGYTSAVISSLGATAKISDDLRESITSLSERIYVQTSQLDAYQQKLEEAKLAYGADSAQAKQLQTQIDSLSSALNKNQRSLDDLSDQAKKAGEGLGYAKDIGAQFVDGLVSFAGPAALATAALGGLSAGAESFKEAFTWQAEMDAMTTSINLQLKGVRDANQVWRDAAAFGEKYRFTTEQMNGVTAASVGILRESKSSFTDLAGVLARMQVLAPGKSIEEAAFSLRELQSGDITSIAEQFNISRAKAYEMRDAIVAGGDVVQQMAKYLDGAGVSMATLEARTQGAKGAMNDLVVQQEDLKKAQAEWAQGPGLQLLELQTNVIRGLVRVMTGDWSPAIQSLKQDLAAGAAQNAGWITDLLHWGDEAGKASAKADVYKNVLGLLGGAGDQAAAATDKLTGATGQAAGAVGQLTGGVKLTADQLKKYQDDLGKTGDKAEDGFQKIRDAQADDAKKREDLYSQLAGKFEEIDKDKTKKLGDLDKAFYDDQVSRAGDAQLKLEDLRKNSNVAIEKMMRDGYLKLDEINTSFHDDELSRQYDHDQKLGEIAHKRNELLQDYERANNDAMAQLSKDLADVQSDAAQTRLDNEAAYGDDLISVHEDLTSKLRDIDQKYADDQADALQDSIDRQRDYQDQLYDLNQQAANRAADSTQDYADKRADAEQDHVDKLAELQADLANATKDSDKNRIQEQIDAENKKYAEDQARAERDFQQQQERDARDLAQAQEKLAREQAQAEQAAAAKLAQQQAAYERERQAAVDAEAAKEAELAKAYAKQQADLDSATQEKLNTVQSQYDAEASKRAEKLASDQADIDYSIEQEKEGYRRKEEEAKLHYDRQLAALQLAVDTQISDNRDALQRQEQDLKDSYGRQQSELLTNFNAQKQAADADALEKQRSARQEYEKQTAAQQEAYDAQLVELNAALGEQLAAYTDIQRQMTAISVEEAAKRKAQIAAEFGYSADANSAQRNADLGRYDANGGGSPGLAQAYASGYMNPGGTTPATYGNVTININGAQNPNATAQATIDAINSVNRNNGKPGI